MDFVVVLILLFAFSIFGCFMFKDFKKWINERSSKHLERVNNSTIQERLYQIEMVLWLIALILALSLK